jgi:hypothetical protein
MATQTYSYFDGFPVTLAFWTLWGSVANVTRTKTIKWDPAQTQITSAKIHGKVEAPIGTTGQIYFNDELTHYCDAQLSSATIETEVDISGLLRNGDNSVKVELTKFTLSGTGYFSAWLIIDYTGVVPSEEPWWQKYLLPVAIGAGALFFITTLFFALRGGQKVIMVKE